MSEVKRRNEIIDRLIKLDTKARIKFSKDFVFQKEIIEKYLSEEEFEEYNKLHEELRRIQWFCLS